MTTEDAARDAAAAGTDEAVGEARSDVTRRTFLAAGTAGAVGMAALAGSPFTAPAEAAPGVLAEATGTLVGAGLSPPPAIAGASVRVMSFADATGFGNFVSFGDPGTWTSAGNMRYTIPLEPGDRLARIDIYAVRAGSPRYAELRRLQVNTAVDTSINGVIAGSSDGLKVMAYQPPGGITVGPGEVFYVLDNNSGSTEPYIGAIVQYFPAVPQLRILPAPVRIYDSRPGPPTTTTPKGKFTNETRVVDSGNNGSGVPNTAKAVIVNFAVTNTNSGGYGTLWAAGIADPGTASLNWSPTASSTLNNSVLTAVDTNGQFNVKIAGSADVILDVVAYYA